MNNKILMNFYVSNGGTSVLFESTPTYPDPGRYWETVQRLKINVFYTAPTAIRLLIRYDKDNVTKYDLSSLKMLGSGIFASQVNLFSNLIW
jgi:acetyl-CoA synthetase